MNLAARPVAANPRRCDVDAAHVAIRVFVAEDHDITLRGLRG